MSSFPKHYMLKKEHQNSYEIADSRDNKSFHVAKALLDDKHHKQIKGLQKFANGGDVEPSDESPTAALAPVLANASLQSPTPQAATNDDWSGSTGVIKTPGGQEPVKPDLALPQAAAKDETVNQQSRSDLLQKFGKNQQSEENAFAQKNKEDVSKANEEVAPAQAYVDTLTKANDTFQQKFKDLDLENSNLTKAVMDQSIDPQRYVHNMSTGNKIMSAIAIGLGAIGGGLSGQPNEALAVINKAISDDVEMQKEDLGKKKSLLSVNMQKYGNLEHAMAATTQQMQAMTQGQIALITAKHAGAINQANGQYLLSGLKQKNMMDQSTLATNLATQGVANQAISGSGIPSQALSLLPEKERANMVQLPTGNWASAGSAENAKAVNEAAAPYKPLMTDLNSLKELNTLGTLTSKAQRDRATALQLHIVTELNDMAKAHRISEADIGFQEGQLSKPASIMNKLSGDWNASTDQLMTSLSNKIDNVYKTYVPAYKGRVDVGFKPKGK